MGNPISRSVYQSRYHDQHRKILIYFVCQLLRGIAPYENRSGANEQDAVVSA